MIKDDVTLLSDFFNRIDEIENLFFEEPTIIQLFTRGKRFASFDKNVSALNSTLYSADFPPGQTALYLINRAAITQATRFTKGMGDSDWPLWGRKTQFLMSYPWIGVEYAAGTTLPVYSRTRGEYYLWLLKVILGLPYWKWRKEGLGVRDYYYYLIYPTFLQLLLRLSIYEKYNNEDPNSIWIKRKLKFRFSRKSPNHYRN